MQEGEAGSKVTTNFWFECCKKVCTEAFVAATPDSPNCVTGSSNTTVTGIGDKEPGLATNE
jgi:uncharacterized protein (DUF1499 family)